jgi:MoxR-like ATPase
MATQNPIEQEGTYPLPEAQMDRFLMHVYVGYPEEKSERDIMLLVRNEEEAAKTVAAHAAIEKVSQDVIFAARSEIHTIQMAPAVEQYIVDLIEATRYPDRYDNDLRKWIQFGASPRGTIALDKCSRAYAWLRGGQFVRPDDVQAIAHDALRHRILLSYDAQAEGIKADQVIDKVIQLVAVA